MQAQIRQAAPRDCDAACELLAELHQLHADSLGRVFRSAGSKEGFRQRFLELVSAPDSAVLLAEANGSVVGVAAIAVRETSDRLWMAPRRYGWVESLVVGSDCRRSGVGRLLMQAAERWAAENGAATCELNVWEFNRDALDFYEEIGYSTASRRMWKELS